MSLQGSGGPFVSLRVVPGIDNDERADGFLTYPYGVPARQEAAPVLWPGGNVVTRDPRGSAGLVWRWNDDDRTRALCARSRSEILFVLCAPLLGAVNLRNKCDGARFVARATRHRESKGGFR